MTASDPAAGAPAPAAVSSGDAFSRTDPPLYEVALWPHRSMTRSGFRWFVGLMAVGLTIPMLAVVGTPAAIGLAPFLLGALAAVWATVRGHDRRRARQGEVLRLWADRIAVEHFTGVGKVMRWQANPYWVTVDLSDSPRAERYLTLTGGGRRIELGGFLTPEEREALAEDLRAALKAVAEGRRPEPPRRARLGDGA